MRGGVGGGRRWADVVFRDTGHHRP